MTLKQLPNIKSIEKCSVEIHTFEKAVEILGIGRFHYICLLICGLSTLASMTEQLSITFALPGIERDIEISELQHRLLKSTTSIGNLLTLHLFGFMADTWGRRKVQRLCLLSTFLFSLLSSLCVNASVMVILRFLVGLW